MRRLMLSLSILTISACSGDVKSSTGNRVDTQTLGAVDADADGFDASEDCDDDNPDIYPGSVEVCDDVDNDCDDEIDEADALDAPTWYVDSDSDGYGDELDSVTQCSAPSGYVAKTRRVLIVMMTMRLTTRVPTSRTVRTPMITTVMDPSPTRIAMVMAGQRVRTATIPLSWSIRTVLRFVMNWTMTVIRSLMMPMTIWI